MSYYVTDTADLGADHDAGHLVATRIRSSSANQMEGVYDAYAIEAGVSTSMVELGAYANTWEVQPADSVASSVTDLSGWINPDTVAPTGWMASAPLPARTSLLLPPGRYAWWHRVWFTGAVGAGGQTPAATDRVEPYMDYGSDPNLVSESVIETGGLGVFGMTDALGGQFAESFGESSNRAHVVGHGVIVISRHVSSLPIVPLVYITDAATALRWLRSTLVVTRMAG
jgi:hypothetical protein